LGGGRMTRKFMTRIHVSIFFVLSLIFVSSVFGFLSHWRMDETNACAFGAYRPATYEGAEDRAIYITAIEAASANRLLPSDSRFSLDSLEQGDRYNRATAGGHIPATLIKGIAWIETRMTMATKATMWSGVGDSTISFDCGHGIMQVTTGMTTPLGANNQPSDTQALTATHFAYNIARGVKILGSKWNNAPESAPIMGTDTNSSPEIIENWYYATWAYNGFTGAGSSSSNHPLDPVFAWPRTPYQCNGSQSHNQFPYQELVWGCIKNPPSVDGSKLWSSIPVSLPDLNDPRVRSALAPNNFFAPYTNMDLTTPQPSHAELVSSPTEDQIQIIIGNPVFSASDRTQTIRINNPAATMWVDVPVKNFGTGLSTWRAKSDSGFLQLSPPTGIAIGSDYECNSSLCEENSLRIEVNPTLLPGSYATGTVTIWSPNTTNDPIKIQINVLADFELTFPGSAKKD